MASRVSGKVAFITGAGRGQGRSHAIRLAEDGADLILTDICADYSTLPYALATRADLDETVRAVEALGRRAVASVVDVRDAAAVSTAVAQGVEALGRLDIVVANAGITVMSSWADVTEEVWRDIIDTNLTGAWNTMRAAVPHLQAAGGGSIICIGSSAAVKGLPFLGPYAASKHGLVGIALSMANELAAENIRINLIHPSSVDTPILGGRGAVASVLSARPDLVPLFHNALPVDTMSPRDISNGVLYLASDEARYVTGLELTLDAGSTMR